MRNKKIGAISVRFSTPYETPQHKEKPPQPGVSRVWRCLGWWSWREPKGNTQPKSTIYFFVKNQKLNEIESLTRDTPALGWHPKMESRVYPFGQVLGWLAFADAGSIPNFSRASGNPLLRRVAVSQWFTSRRISVGTKCSAEDSACIVQSKLGFFEVHGFFPRASILKPSLGKLSLCFLDVLIHAVEVLGGVVVHHSKVPDATPFGKW